MRPDTKFLKPILLSPLKVAMIYAIFGVLWIVFSDTALHAVVQDPDLEAKLQTGKGWFFILVTAALIYGLTYNLVANARAAHDQIQAVNESLEQRVLDRTASLAARESYIRAVLDHSAEAIITLDNRGIIETFNPAACEVFGYSSDEAIGQSVSILIPEKSRSVHDVYMQNTHQYSKTIINKPRDVVARRKDGENFPIKITISPMIIENETKYVALMHDITTRKSIEEQLVTAKANAEGANRAKSDFLSSMSHELRTPLNAIIGFSDSLIGGVFGKIENEAHIEYLAHIRSSGEHLLELINEILDLSRIEAGKLKLNIEKVSPCDLIHECVNLFSDQAEKHNVSIELGEISPNSIQVSMDERRLRQVLLNLMSNGIKYNQNGGRLNVSCEEPDENTLRIYFTDTGHGIAAKDLENLFVPFNRLIAEETDIPGTGIGLTLCKRLMEEMGGEIGVESIEGKGSKFWIDMPRIS